MLASMIAPAIAELRSFRFEEGEAWAAPPAAPPLDLTASDGTGLVLEALSARVVLDGPLAFTELHLTFRNPEERQIEGRFRVGLPSGAILSRFAMRIGSSWQEGEVVERQAARRAYEDFLHRRQDPALLEHETGNEFSARVFPIEPRSQKEILVSYSHELKAPDAPYRLPVRGLPTIRDLDVRALVGRFLGASGAGASVASSLGGSSSSWQSVEVRKSGWKPDADFEVTPPPSRIAGLRSGNLAVLRVSPSLGASRDEIASLLVLLDTSASRALGFERQVELVLALARGLARGAGPKVPLAVACFDQEVSLCFEGDAGDFSVDHAAWIRRRAALGASDLGAALRWAAGRPRPYERVVVVGDGVSTAGDLLPSRLEEAARALAGAGVGRLDAVAIGGLRDDAALRRLVTAGLPRDGTVCEEGLSPAEIADRLTRATRSGIKVEIPGASWVWPTRLDGVQSGDTVLVYADLQGSEPVRVLLDAQPIGPLELGPAERPLLERAWIKARIEKLEELRARPDTDGDVREGLQKQVIDLSVKHRVLCPYTALLVLETEADYARFNIDRRALADILTVGVGGLEVLHRTGPAFAPAPAPKISLERRREGHKKAKPAAPTVRYDEMMADDVVAGSVDADAGPVAAEEPMAEARPTLRSLDADAEGLTLSSEELSAPRLGASLEDSESDVLFSLKDLLSLEEATVRQEPAPTPAPAFALPSSTSAPAARPPPLSAPAPPAPGQWPAMSAPAPMSAPEAPRLAPESPSLLGRLRSAVSDVLSGLRSEPEVPTEAPRQAPILEPAAAPPPAVLAPEPVARQEPEPAKLGPWEGPFREVMALLIAGRLQESLDRALRWRAEAPGDVLALVAVGEAAEALGDRALAARAYGSLIDLFPSRADLRRFAGERLERLMEQGALTLAIDTYRKALESRPDHPSSHRLLGMALLRAGRPAEAFEVLAAGQARSYPPKFPGVDRILTEDLGLVAAAWLRAEPERRAELLERLGRAGARLEDAPSVRFVLVWETDANDVDFHIHDAAGGHAYYASKQLPSGGELYADITQGYGPECFTVRTAPPVRPYPYKLQAHYFRRGPMGYGMGTLQILEHDGEGGFAFEDRPYVVMADGAYVDLGEVRGPLPVR